LNGVFVRFQSTFNDRTLSVREEAVFNRRGELDLDLFMNQLAEFDDDNNTTNNNVDGFFGQWGAAPDDSATASTSTKAATTSAPRSQKAT
jgi:hypothetical protein